MRGSDSGTEKHLNAEDFANGAKINISATHGNDSLAEGMTHGGGFEGDIILDDEQAAIIANGTSEEKAMLRSSASSSYRKWPKVGSIVKVPYEIDYYAFDYYERGVIARGISEFHQKTCIR